VEKGDQTKPVTFFLNERHELLPAEKPKGGRTPHYLGVDWASKGKTLTASLVASRGILAKYHDPIRESRYYLLARPSPVLQKRSTAKNAVDNALLDQVSFAKSDSLVFRRLGIELINVTDTGDAIVHLLPERADQLEKSGARLASANAREQARWAKLDTFGVIPAEDRIDATWLKSLPPGATTEAVIEFQPLLGRIDIEKLMRSISEFLRKELKESFTRIGQDFSGRFWAAGRFTPGTLQEIARLYFTIQALHPPLTATTLAGGSINARSIPGGRIANQDPTLLPTVAIVDTGVPSDHAILAEYRRGQFIAPGSVDQTLGDHGSFVASRAVFGDPDFGDVFPETPEPKVRFYDVQVGRGSNEIENKLVVRAIESVAAAAPDVRVFNLSFDTRLPLNMQDPVSRTQHMLLVQDLDNLIFQTDVFVVIAAGNVPQGLQPHRSYPDHIEDPHWQLGAWAQSFNSVTSGSYVNRLHPDGLAPLGWPSPFARVGPGLADSPKPDFSAPGGNCNSQMGYAPGLGVWGLTARSNWEDKPGTSFAAPLVASEAAAAFRFLQGYCPAGAVPYAATVRAFLTLSATLPDAENLPDKLRRHALGNGIASCTRLLAPTPESAVFLWQGTLEDPSHQAQITLPIPKSWLKSATKPRLRIVTCWHPPTNAAVADLWACRKIALTLRPNLEADAIRGKGPRHLSYPVIDRTYDLATVAIDATTGDTWLIDLSYSDIGEYYVGQEFSPQQKVAFAAELFDASPSDGPGVQASVQALPIATSMTMLSSQATVVSNAVVVKLR